MVGVLWSKIKSLFTKKQEKGWLCQVGESAEGKKPIIFMHYSTRVTLGLPGPDVNPV